MKGLLLGLFIVISCSNQNRNNMNQWSVIQATGLKKNNEEFNSMLFINGKDGFLFGTNYSDEIILNKKFNEQSAVIYRTEDGGRNWIGNEICKGRFVSSFNMDDTVFALGNNCSKENYALINESFLYVSFDKGIKWKLVYRFPFYVRNIFFVGKNTGIAITTDLVQNDSVWHISKTIDGGKSWHEIYKDVDITNPFLFKSDLWYLSKNPVTNSSNKHEENLIKINTANESLTKEKVPDGFNAESFTITKDNIFIAGMKDNKVSIYKRVREDICERIKDFSEENLFPQSIHTYDKAITLIATKLKQFSTDYKIYMSLDSGKTWREDKLPIPEYFNPIAFYMNRMWGYAGSGRVQTNY